MPPTLPLPPLVVSRPRASSSLIAALGIISTEAMERTPNNAGNQNTAVKPNCHPSSPDRPAPTMLPA